MNISHCKKALLTLSLLLFSILIASAAHLTVDEALQSVKYNGGRFSMPSLNSSTTLYTLAYTAKSADEDMVYVVNNNRDGFMVISADDRLPALLGYSNSGEFDVKKAPPALIWWLQQYSAEASYYFNKESQYTVRAMDSNAPKAAVPVLLSTQWDQGAPFNNDCPVDGSGRSVTGCVATAMAQVINYHKYPAQGSGTHSYQWNNKTLSFDYGSTTFDFANMLDNYGNGYTSVQAAAVANLMYACGVGVNMGYSSWESGAGDLYIGPALKNYFNYDGGIRYLKRIYFSNEEWDNLVYEELAANRPVIYGGQAPDGGHEFVCDGYDGNGMFHINWGWSGSGNGYFLLSALDPGLQGIGGFAGGYNSEQAIVCGIQPGGSGSTAWYPIYATEGLNVDNVQYNQFVTFSFGDGHIFNYSPDATTVSFYLKVVSESGKITYSDRGYELPFPGANGLSISGYGSCAAYIPQNLEAGNYTAYLVFKTPEGNWQDLLIPRTGSSYLDMTVDSDGNVAFTEAAPAEKAKIEVTTFRAQSIIQSGVKTTFDISVTNIGDIEYSGVFYVKVFKSGSEEMVAQNGIQISLAPSENLTGTVGFTYSLPDGEYDAICYDKYGDVISKTFPLYIGTPPVNVSAVNLDKTEARMEVESTLQLTATISPAEASDKRLNWESSNPEIATISEEGLVTAISPGEAVITATASNGIKGTCVITVTAKEIAATGIQLDKTEATMAEGETLILTPTIDPETTTDKSVTWESSNTEVATVENGSVKAIKAGEAVITAKTANGLSASCTVTVKAQIINATGIALDKTEATMTEGETLILTPTVDPENATDKTVTWESSNPEVATVEKGSVKAIKTGEAVITAKTANGLSASCKVTVNAKVIAATGIALDKTEATMTEGETLILTATVDPENATDKTVTWESSNPEVATVENGSVKAIKAGEAVITAKTANGLSASCTITVNEKEPEVILATSITLDKTEIQAVAGNIVTLHATVLPKNATDKTVEWSSSNESVATVNNSGTVTILSVGTAVITASTTDGSELSAKCHVSGMSGIEAIVAEAGLADVYTTTGIIVKLGADSNFISTLSKGYYIICVGNKTYTIMK